MEISGKVLREVEFRDRLRGYDTDEVDEFLEKVAIGVEALRAQLDELEAEVAVRPPPQGVPAPGPAPVALDDDSIRRTLVLAQRTADLAVSEAREEAARLLEEARAEAESIVGRAEDGARRLRADTEQDLHSRVARLSDERERLEREVRSLARLVEEERTRLTDSLSSALRYVKETLSVSDDLAQRQGEPPAPPASSPGEDGPSGASDPLQAGWPPAEVPASGTLSGGEVADEPASPSGEVADGEVSIPDVEREIGEDAATAYTGADASGEIPRQGTGFVPGPGGGHVGTPRPLGRPDHGGDEALWERWAAGRDLGVVPGPGDFAKPTSAYRTEQDGGWSA